MTFYYSETIVADSVDSERSSRGYQREGNKDSFATSLLF